MSQIRIPYLTTWLEKRAESSSQSNPARWLIDMFGGGQSTYTGKYINEHTAMQTITVFACVRVLSDSLASIPLVLYKNVDEGRERAKKHWLYPLLHDLPNSRMTSFTFRQVLHAHLVTWGNCYADIQRNKASGRIKALLPLRPDRMRMEINETTGEIIYIYTVAGKERLLYPENVLHIPGLGFDGLKGYSVIAMARQGIALAQATEEYGARFFGNGARPGGVLRHPKALSKPAFDRLKEQFGDEHQGLDNAHKLKILEEGMEYTQIGLPPEDSQFLETRKYQRTDIASLFHVPPHMIGDLDRATFSNIEQQSIDFVVNTMRPWFVLWEQSLNWKLLNSDPRYYCEFLIDALLRGDSKSRAEFYTKMFMIGVYSQNDIRKKENENLIIGGDKYFVPLNMRPHDTPFTVPKTIDPAPKGGEDKNAEPE